MPDLCLDMRTVVKVDRRMNHEHTADELKWLAANARFYKVERLIHSRERDPDRPQEVVFRSKDLDALRRAARKVALAELKARVFADLHAHGLVADARVELRQAS